jgi:hypothetical protein
MSLWEVRCEHCGKIVADWAPSFEFVCECPDTSFRESPNRRVVPMGCVMPGSEEIVKGEVR